MKVISDRLWPVWVSVETALNGVGRDAPERKPGDDRLSAVLLDCLSGKADADGYRFVGERCIRSEQRTRGPRIEDQMHAIGVTQCSSWRRPSDRGSLVAQGSIRSRIHGAQESAYAPPRMYTWSATGSGSAAAGEMPVLAVAASAAVSAIR